MSRIESEHAGTWSSPFTSFWAFVIIFSSFVSLGCEDVSRYYCFNRFVCCWGKLPAHIFYIQGKLLTGLATVQYVESGRGQLGAQKPAIPISDDSLSTDASNEQKNKDPASPAVEHTHNNREDNTHNDEDLNEIACKIGDIILNESDGLGGKQSIKDQNPAVKQLDQNVAIYPRSHSRFLNWLSCRVGRRAVRGAWTTRSLGICWAR